jgi:uncharacterized membrane protein YqjE
MVFKAQGPEVSRPTGLLGSIKELGATLLAMAHTRLELFSVELEEEWGRIRPILVWSLAAMFCAITGVVFATLFLLFALPEYRTQVAGIAALVFFLVAVVAWRVVAIKVRDKPRAFGTSLAEFSKDREQLGPRP